MGLHRGSKPIIRVTERTASTRTSKLDIIDGSGVFRGDVLKHIEQCGAAGNDSAIQQCQILAYPLKIQLYWYISREDLLYGGLVAHTLQYGCIVQVAKCIHGAGIYDEYVVHQEYLRRDIIIDRFRSFSTIVIFGVSFDS